MQPHHRLYPDQPAVYCLASRDIDPSSVRTGSVGPPRDRHAPRAFRRVDPLPTEPSSNTQRVSPTPSHPRLVVTVDAYSQELSSLPTPTLTLVLATILWLLPDESQDPYKLDRPRDFLVISLSVSLLYKNFLDPNMRLRFVQQSNERRMEEFEISAPKSGNDDTVRESTASKSAGPVLNCRYC